MLLRRLPRVQGGSLVGARVSRRAAVSGGKSKFAGTVSVLVRECFILSGIAGAAMTTIGMVGYAAEQGLEAGEDSAEPIVGRRIALPDGRQFHVRDTRDYGAQPRSAATEPGAGDGGMGDSGEGKGGEGDGEALFAAAVTHARSPACKPPTSAEKARIYGLYKQATIGDCVGGGGGRPGLWDPVGRAKYDAWAACKGLGKVEARAEYAALIGRVDGAFLAVSQPRCVDAPGDAASRRGGVTKRGAAGAAAGATMTVVFEAGQGETLLEWEQVVQHLAQTDPALR